MASSVTSYASLRVSDIRKRFSAGPTTGVFTDGSAMPNPGPGGWGYVYVIEGNIVAEDRGSDPQTTNNRMELTALIQAYKALPIDTSVVVYSDSNLCVQTVNTWAKGWEKNGWRRKDGPIANLDLVRALYDEHLRRPNVTLTWIKAHNGWLWNEYADALSTAWAREEL